MQGSYKMKIYKELQEENLENETKISELNELKDDLRKNAFGAPSSSTMQYVILML